MKSPIRKIELIRELVSQDYIDKCSDVFYDLLAEKVGAGKINMMNCLLIKDIFEIGFFEVSKDE